MLLDFIEIGGIDLKLDRLIMPVENNEVRTFRTLFDLVFVKVGLLLLRDIFDSYCGLAAMEVDASR
jgi:hypothetical protein